VYSSSFSRKACAASPIAERSVKTRSCSSLRILAFDHREVRFHPSHDFHHHDLTWQPFPGATLHCGLERFQCTLPARVGKSIKLYRINTSYRSVALSLLCVCCYKLAVVDLGDCRSTSQMSIDLPNDRLPAIHNKCMVRGGHVCRFKSKIRK
jgi:hypothetical protein